MKLTKSMVLYFSLFLIFILAGCGNQTSTTEGSTTSENMKPITLKFADFFPATHPAKTALIQEWADRVEAATEGLVKVEVYPGETLIKSSDIYEGVVSNIADVGHSVSGYNPGRLPVLNAMYLGGVEYKSAKVSSYVARDLIQELQPAELEDTQIMFVYGISPGVLMTTKPVRTLEDLKGLQIRASGTNVKTLELLGATPVAMTIGETYEAMSKGVVDGSLLPAEGLKSFKLGEVTKYVTNTSLIYNTVHYVTMNRDVWESFPKGIQDAISQVNQEIFLEATEFWDGVNEAGVKYAVENNGVEVITLSDEENERWKEKLKSLHGNYIKELDKKGIAGEEVLNTIIQLADKYNNEFHN